MKKIVTRLFAGGSAKVNLMLVLCVFAFVGLGCFGGGRNRDAKPIPPVFLGEWTAQDGAKLNIRADGTGDYIAGSTEIKGGTAEVDEATRTISITFFGLGKTLKVDSPPQGDVMKLDGVTFKRKGGFAPDAETASEKDSSNSKNGDDSGSGRNDSSKLKTSTDKNMPSEEDVEALVRDTLAQFNDAVENEDFTDFHANSSRDFQATYTAEQMKNSFQVFIDKKAQVNPILRQIGGLTPDYSTAPNITTEKGYKLLNVDGSYATTPSETIFELQYELENKVWKLLKIKVRFQ